MSREWKPGDVALVTAYDPPKMALVRPRRESQDTLLEFSYAEGGYDPVGFDGSEARPLVVIDPENREQVERLASALNQSLDFADASLLGEAVTAALADTLRSLVEPPKPEEPLGLGAVVEASAYTDKVRTFVRCSGDGGAWSDSSGNFHTWSELDVVRILADGWQGESDE